VDIEKAFHPFDIRGDYPLEVDEKMAYNVGRFVESYLPPGAVLVAADNRDSSPSITNALVNGLTANNREVVFIGNLPTPIFYFAVSFLKATGGVMVTASHVNAKQNGFKFVKVDSEPWDEGEILTLKDYLKSHENDSHPENISKVSVKDALANRNKVVAEYISQLVGKFSNLKVEGLILFDTGETVAAPILEEILSRLSLNFKLFKTPRDLNPLIPEGNSNLRAQVKAQNAALGVIYDGDADRVIFIDKEGNLIPQSYILGLIGKRFTKAAFDIRAGLAAYTTDHVVTPSWAQNLKFAMKEDPKIGFAGETSGHLIFKEWYGIDDGIFGGFKFLELVKNFDEELSQLKSSYIDIPEINYNLPGDYALALDKIADYYRSKDYLVSVVDGVTLVSSDFHFNLRPSLTEPFLRLNLEVKRPEQAEEIKQELQKLIYE